MSGLTFTWLKKRKRDSGQSPLLKISGLRVRVGLRRVLDGVDLEVFEGDHVHVSGPNGSGKSTLLNAIMGVPPAVFDGGRMEFLGKDLSPLQSHERAGLGFVYLKQVENIFSGLSVKENLLLAHGSADRLHALSSLPMWGEIRPMLHRPAGMLSGGQRQKLAHLMCHRENTRLLLADEPDAGIDSWDGISGTSTYILITHGN